MGWLEFQYEREAKRQENKREETDHDVPSGWREPTIQLRAVIGWIFWGVVLLGTYAVATSTATLVEVASAVAVCAGAWLIAYALDSAVAVLVGD